MTSIRINKTRIGDSAVPHGRLVPMWGGSQPESISGVPEQRGERRLDYAQMPAIARAVAGICNDERASFGVVSGRERQTFTLKESGGPEQRAPR